MVTRKLFFALILPALLGACSVGHFYPYQAYDGQSLVVTGGGAFLENRVSDMGVVFLHHGLPNNEECALLGRYEYSGRPGDYQTMAAHIREAGGNTATQAAVTWTVAVDGGDMLLDRTSVTRVDCNAFGTCRGYSSYLVFECAASPDASKTVRSEPRDPNKGTFFWRNDNKVGQ